MAMELDLSTDKAQKALDAVEKKLGTTQAAIDRLDATQADKVATALKNIKAPDKGVTTAITNFGTAVNNLSGSASTLNSLANALRGLNNNSVSQAGKSVQALAQSLHGIQVPPGLATTAQLIRNIGFAADFAAARVHQLKAGLNGVGAAGAQAGMAANGLNQIGGAASGAVGGVSRLSSGMSVMQGILQGVGQSIAQLVGGSLSSLASGSIEAAQGLVNFSSKMQAAGQDAVGVRDSLRWVEGLANKFGQPIGIAAEAFSKMSIAMSETGYSSEATRQAFTGFSTAFAAFGLNADQTKRAMNAVNQMFTKGTVTMEELRQQLGEVFPAFGLLAASMGKTTSELAAMMKQGQVSSDVLIKFADDLQGKFAPMAAYIAENGVAPLNRMYNALTKLQQFGGEAFLSGLKEGLNSFASTLKSQEVQALAAQFGYLAGVIGGVVLQVLGFLAQSLAYTFATLQTAGGFIAGFVTNLFTLADVGGVVSGTYNYLAGIFEGLGYSLDQFAPMVVGVGIALFGLAKAAQAGGAAIQLLSTPMGIFALKVVAAGIAVVGVIASFVVLASAANAAYRALSGDGTFTDNFNQNITVAGQVVADLSQKLADSAKSALGLSQPLTLIEKGAEATGVDLKTLANSAVAAGNGTTTLANSAPEAASGTENLGDAAGSAATDVRDLGTNSGSAASTVSGAGRAASTSARQIDSLAASANRAADAMERLARAKAAAGGGGGGGGSSDVSSQSGGGIAGSMKRTQTVPNSSFKNVPHLAGGLANTNSLTPSLPGGGIPTVLHPNEAVVPLAGGGAIPVAVGGGTAQSSGGSSEALTLARSMNTSLGRILERMDAAYPEVIKQLKNLVSFASVSSGGSGSTLGLRVTGTRSSGGGGSGSGGGSSSGGASGSSGGKTGDGQIGGFDYSLYTQFQSLQNAYSQAVAKANASEVELQGVRFGGPAGASVYYAPQKLVEVQARNRAVAEASQALSLFQKAHPDFMAQLQKPTGNKKPQSFIGGYATGTPNTSKEMKGGGMHAVVHPNEAIIPLPDGRSVPVDMSSLLKQKARDASNNNQTGGGNNNRPINITMNIQTPDGNSFRQSQDQMMNELRAKLARGQEKLGPPTRVLDDPTRRVK